MFGFSLVENNVPRPAPAEVDGIEPLGFELLGAIHDRLHEPLQFQLSMPAAAADAAPVPTDLALAMDGPNAAAMLGLVSGGWVPVGLWKRDAVLMPDQQAISAIRKHLHGRAAAAEAAPDFIDRLADETLRFNPTLFMIQGLRGRLPKTVAELAEGYRQFQARIGDVLPKAQIFPAQAEAVQSAIGLLDQRRRTLEREKRFLLAAMPLLLAEAGKSRRLALWQQLLGIAQQHQVAPASQLFIAVLSATAALPELNPARELLSPAKPYMEREAYAALAKLRALDALSAAIALHEQTQTVLLTQDRALALWWSGVKPYGQSRSGKVLNYRLKLDRQLFQRLDGEEWEQLTALIFQTPAATAKTAS